MSDSPENEVSKETGKKTLVTRLRNYFLTGLLVTAPPALTIYLAVLFVNFIDSKVRRFIPEEYNPEQYLPFAIPGLGVVVVIIFLIVLGAFTTGYLGRLLVRLWERMWEKIPLVSGIYSTFKQLFETVFSQKSNAFSQVVMVEFPRKDAWTVAFVTSDVPYVLSKALKDDDLVSVYVPTTPNPTSGYWSLYHKKDVIPLDISVEDGLKMIVSLGIVSKRKEAEN
ncbi:MAG: DUF502 domain-containing protein [Alphaproteobacteria bacterium]|nr:DUF502 domain-containing protein [Alphaproteobacteria bacterium]MBO4643777.1 DUF502 domain-containing protein [Alphaproteobacteria bacterium]